MNAPRYSIIPGAFAEDPRADVYHFRILNFIGRHTDNEGWCRLKQGKIAEALGVTRECVNRKIAELVEWRYLDKLDEDEEAGRKSSGRAIWYRTIMDRPAKPKACADDGPGDEPDIPRETPGAPVSGGSQAGYNLESELQGRCDRQGITPGVIVCDHSKNDPSLTTKRVSPPTPSSQPSEGEGGILDSLLKDIGPEHVLPALRRVLTVVQIQHAHPKALVLEIAEALKAHPENVLGKAADWLIQNRKKIVSVKCVIEAAAKAEASLPLIHIRPGDPSFAAWMAHYRDRPATQAFARQHGLSVRSVWPPGWSTKRQEAAE